MWRLRTSGDRFLTIAGLPATLGSDEDNDLRLRHASVLPHHARFLEGPDGTLAVEAIGESVVGVGGRQVKRGTLGNGEQLILGRLRFSVERAAGAASHQPRPRSPPTPALRERTARPRPARASATLGAAAADELISTRDKTLRYSKQPARRGALDVDFAQLSGGWKALIVLAMLALGAGVLWGVSLLTGLAG